MLFYESFHCTSHPPYSHGEELKKFSAFTSAEREGKEGKREGSLIRKCNMYFLQDGRHGGLVADSCHLNMSNYLTFRAD